LKLKFLTCSTVTVPGPKQPATELAGDTYLVWRCPQKITVNDMAMSPALKLKAAVHAQARSGLRPCSGPTD
jgi:hypothetical protein